MTFSLKRQAVHAHARAVAAQYYIRRGYVPALPVEIAKATASDEAFLKYREDQPRVPAGNGRESGRWTDEGGGGGNGTTSESEYPDAIRPIYPVETFLAALSGGSVISALRYVLGSIARNEVGSAVQDAAAAIEDYFGGKPDRTFRNPSDDLIMMKGDKKIRIDINKFAPHDEPHFHIQKQNSNGKWIDAGEHHWYPFSKE
ncbi:MAG: hypothetical protein WC521_02805 [Bdellovibrionales bacterium]